jgi:hypothetical protein
MAKTTFVPKETITLEKLQVGLVKRLSDLSVYDVELREIREYFMEGTAYELRAYVLADHVESKEVSYTHHTLPWWLKWADRWVKKEEHVLKLDAYHTYPKANVKMPKLGPNYTTITKSDLNMTESD